ncbi:unnamed protein product, partial [Ectocarpus sp. 12 AP-2014]
MIVTPPTPAVRGPAAAAVAVGWGARDSAAKGVVGSHSSRRDSSSSAPGPPEKGASSGRKKKRASSSSSGGGGSSKKAAVANGIAAGEGGDDCVVVPASAVSRHKAGRVEDDRGMVGREVWKTFSGVPYHGTVAYAHVLVDSGEVLYHVLYDDGDQEDMEHA